MGEKFANRYWGSRTPAKSKAEFFGAVTTPAPSGEGDIATIRMFGPIDSWGGWWGVSTTDIGQVLDELPDTVVRVILRINSPGGEVSEAVAILNMLRAHKSSITAVVDGLAASAASVIAAGCDETVMSPGTQMMIHSPWSIAAGNATELRKTADVLDNFESTLIEIYSGKAGADHDWPGLLAEETWLNSQAAVDLGLADRIAVIPDAGETATPGGDPDDDNDDVEDTTDILVASIIPTPVASASGTPTGKETAVAFSDDQLNTMRASLGLADDADETAIMSAVTARPTPQLPDGVVTIDASALDELRTQAQAGVEARAHQKREERDRYIDNAISRGKFAAARRDNFVKLYDADPEGTRAIIDELAENTIPVAEAGFDADGETVAAADDAAVAAFAARMGFTNGAR
ncbi:head maturation protease, ClpP-related [Microbacterium karelineae]|uniref:head maturation protease, ClpP-related n=1 Tax=Microbacterium karelineae TaxID=2654283 RepID=UPI0012EAD694|nr:head maturation protease, ClpP-related [Microbacterium karelineae]